MDNKPPDIHKTDDLTPSNQSERTIGDDEEIDKTGIKINIDSSYLDATKTRNNELDDTEKASLDKKVTGIDISIISANSNSATSSVADSNDEDDDFDDVIDIRDNANDEDQFAFDENNVSSDLQQGEIPGTCLAAEIPDVNGVNQLENDGDDNGGPVEEGAAAAHRVTFSDDDEINDYHYDHHHIEDHYARSHPHEEDGDYSQDEKTLDVLLLEEICEEAASMTIKEALIHSLKPNVRAGLTTAHLRLSESEILTLEGYCEDFVGGLIKDLLKRTSLLQNIESQNNTTTQAVVQAATIKTTAKQLSAMDLKQLKVYCDHFVHNVIAESIIDSSMIVAKQQDQADKVKNILQVFNDSDELHEYFTSLTTDIVRTALINVVNKDQLEESIEVETTAELESSAIANFSVSSNHSVFLEGELGQEDSYIYDDNSFNGVDTKQTNQRQNPFSQVKENSVKSKPKRRKLPQQPVDTPLEFDMDWVEGALHNIGVADGDLELRHKITMRELDFDDRVNARGNEVLAPVFLAIAEENDDDNDFQGMRRKTQSIEDLCDIIEDDFEPPRKRSSSLNQPKPKQKHPKLRQPSPSFEEYIHDIERPTLQEELEECSNECLEEDDFSEAKDDNLIEDNFGEKPESNDEHISQESQEGSKTMQEGKVYRAYDDDQFRWHTIRINNREKVLDLRLIEPYMKVITHGGVHIPSRAVIVVVAACYLPDKSKRNYDFLMEQLFFYLISTLELLATADEYFLVYLNGGTSQANMPALPWMKRFYQHIEGGLKQQLIKMFIVHPNLWLKTVVRFARAFVGTNFWNKLEFTKSLDDLSRQIPTEFMYIPDEVIRCDPTYKRLHNL